jgi:hypothetical protein
MRVGFRQVQNSTTRIFLICFLWLSATALMAQKFLKSLWLANDDFLMSQFMSGTYTGQKEVNTVFMHQSFGQVVEILDGVLPNIQWYPTLLILLQCIALSVLAGQLHGKHLFVMWVFIATAHIAWSTMLPSFTPASIVVGVCGGGIIYLHIRNQGKLPALISGATLLTISAAIRFDGFLLSLLFLFPLFLSLILEHVGFRQTLPSIIVLAFMGLLLIYIHETPIKCDSSAECKAWGQYMEFNEIRGTFHSSPRMSELKQRIDKTNWSENDLTLFSKFNFIDSETFDLGQMQEIDRKVPTFSISKQWLKDPVKSMGAPFASNNQFLNLFYLSYVTFVIVVLMSNKYIMKHYLVLVSSTLWWLLAVSIVGTIRLPLRILEPATIGLGIILLIWADSYFSSSTRNANTFRVSTSQKNLHGVFTAGITLLLGINLLSISGQSRQNEKELKLISGSLDSLSTLGAENKFILKAGKLANGNPWISPSKYVNPNSIGLGWATNSPHFKKRKEMLSIDSIYNDLVLESKSKLLFVGFSEDASYVQVYLKEHLQSDTSAFCQIPMSLVNDGFCAWEISRK